MSTVLVIEDEEAIRQNLRDLLEAEGFDVAVCGNGSDGIAAARAVRPDLVLCDIMMPDVDGYDVLTALHSDPSTSLIPFVFLTALADKADVRLGMTKGADDFVTKPFTRDELLAAVRTRLSRQEVAVGRLDTELQRLRDSVSLSLPHELRTPLTSIVAGAALLDARAGVLPEADLRRLAGVMRTSASRLERLIANYLLYAELNGTLSVNRGRAPDGSETSDARLAVREAAERTALEYDRVADLTLRLAPGTVAIAADHLGKIIEELVDNAMKFSEPGSKVLVSGKASGEGYVVTVKDSGCGIGEADLARLGAFMQFGRDEREQQGSGLGLTLATLLAEMYGGGLLVQSESGAGTTVSATLPAHG